MKKPLALLAALLVGSWSVAANPGENNQKDDGQKNQKDDGQNGQNGNAEVNELKAGAVPAKPQLAGKKPAVALKPLAKLNRGGVLDNKQVKFADGQNGQNDDGRQNQKDDGQKNNKDDGQQNNKNDGQQGQNGNGNKKK